MIARRLRLNDVSKSSILRLVTYLTEHQGVGCRVGAVRITGCESETPEWAALEMLAVQQQNHRAKGDKTYHLLVSFREYPDEEAIRQIENELCNGLGFNGHQRVSVQHGDTDNPHLHIAINKIHPKRLTMHEPYYDHVKLGTLCEGLEKEYGLQLDNHEFKAQAAETGAVNMEKAGDVESLIGWIQRTCLEDLQQADSWKKLHGILAKHGLKIDVRGNGLGISSGKIHVKASSVDRNLSKKRLEERLGTFEPASREASQQKQQNSAYVPKSMQHGSFDAGPLWEKYQQSLIQNTQLRSSALHEVKRQRDAELEAARNTSDRHSVFIRYLTSGVIIKRLLYAMNKRRLRNTTKRIRSKYQTERTQLHATCRHTTWNTWLSNEAKQGNEEALAVMRSRANQQTTGDSITGTERLPVPATPSNKVTRHGTFIHEHGARFTDTHVLFSPHANDAALQEGLELALRHFAQPLVLTGSSAFKANVVRVTAEQQLAVQFADRKLETRRQELVTKLKTSPLITTLTPSRGRRR